MSSSKVNTHRALATSLMDSTPPAGQHLRDTITDGFNNPEIDRGLMEENEHLVILDPIYGGEEGLE